MPRSGVLAAVVCLVLCAGCGNSRTPVPSLTHPAIGGPLRSLHYPAAGVSFSAPRSWTVFGPSPPLVTVLGSGGAVVSVWRYPLAGRVPVGSRQLQAARRALIAAARKRDRGLQVVGTRLFQIGGSPAIELDALERIAGALRRSRATHVFSDHAEIVVDEYAPVGVFGAVDAGVFSPLDRSLVISSAA